MPHDPAIAAMAANAERAAAGSAPHDAMPGPFPALAEASGTADVRRSLAIDAGAEGLVQVRLGSAQPMGYRDLDALLPYDGVRGVVHRSTSAKTGMLVGRTDEDGRRPRPVGFESGLERATAISALIHPNTFGLKCQPRTVVFERPVGDVQSNTLDFLLTLRTGQRYYLFVKNDDALGRPKSALIGDQIRRGLPEGYGFAVISEETFPPYLRGNNERMFLAKRFPDPEADARLADVLIDLIDVACFTVEELVFRCGIGPRKADQGRAFDAILRAIADGALIANRRELIHYPTVLEAA
ncbi:hypothetical protein RSWS8N_19239 [Cereibacter sphaeroides WS8N]|uniref:hypothetical protein n=1 Tax=Cereibacter sphaeroides TaxID=1063 RepID=UPI00020B0405|nr:hypothetical protein [Cereibacter sphaeroides]EGJ20326.1 hypothetical protein RSWS8N_19239 [Cereibacter sphaeroides WS8N]